MHAVIHKIMKSGSCQLDSALVSKGYAILPGKYDIELMDNGEHVVKSHFNISDSKIESKNIKKVRELIQDLFNANMGYKDCEMQTAKFDRLMKCFTIAGKNVDYFE